MKKVYLFFVLLGGLLLTGCIFGNKEKYADYEVHFYDEIFSQTEEIEVNYDKDGNLKDIAVYYNYDISDSNYCEYFKAPEKEYKDAVSECTLNDNGSALRYTYLTAESIKEGALDDISFRPIYYVYESLETKELAENYISDKQEEFKNNNVTENEKNYIVSNNKKVSW